MQQHSLPPVPLKLQEILADYPELIERLQEVLVSSEKQSRKFSLSPFDDAIYALEGRLDALSSEARNDLKGAEAAGDEARIVAAKEKRSAVSKASLKQLWITDERFYDYFRRGFK